MTEVLPAPFYGIHLDQVDDSKLFEKVSVILIRTRHPHYPPKQVNKGKQDLAVDLTVHLDLNCPELQQDLPDKSLHEFYCLGYGVFPPPLLFGSGIFSLFLQ